MYRVLLSAAAVLLATNSAFAWGINTAYITQTGPLGWEGEAQVAATSQKGAGNYSNTLQVGGYQAAGTKQVGVGNYSHTEQWGSLQASSTKQKGAFNEAVTSTVPISAARIHGDLTMARSRRRRCAVEKTSGRSNASAHASGSELNGSPSNHVTAAGVVRMADQNRRRTDDRLIMARLAAAAVEPATARRRTAASILRPAACG